MSGYERWGSLSVDDHNDELALATSVLLYDRVVVPELTEADDREERAYWSAKGWNPDKQALVLAELGDLAVRTPWGAVARQQWRDWMEALRTQQDHDGRSPGFTLTRRVLANPRFTRRSAGVVVIPAYSSFQAASMDYDIGPAADARTAQATLIMRRLVAPDGDGRESLLAAIDLSKDPQFQRKRRDLFEWQENRTAGKTDESAVRRLAELNDQYNEMVEKQYRTVRTRAVFAAVTVGLTLAGAGAGPGAMMLAFGSAVVTLAQFVALDAGTTPEAGLHPAAMFHDIEDKVKLKFR